MTLLHHMKLTHKFLAIGLIALVMVTIPSSLYFSRAMHELEDAQRELRATGPAIAMNKVIQFSQTHRGMSASMLSGDAALEARRPALRDKVNAAIAAADAAFAAAQVKGNDETARFNPKKVKSLL